MNGELAQIVQVATRSTLALSGGGAEPLGSTFQFVADVQFAGTDGRVHQDVDQWLRHLQETGARRVWMALGPPRSPAGQAEAQTAGFVNSGRWALLVTGAGASSVWAGHWTVGDRNAPDRRIWLVRYTQLAVSGLEPSIPPVDQAAAHLDQSLVAVARFAATSGLSGWADHFQAARRGSLNSGSYPDLLPPTWPEPAQRLLATAQAAWVFGGMGSWNDDPAGAGDPAVYRSVTDRLYTSALIATMATVNAPLV